MLAEAVSIKLNEQIGKEFFSAYLYRAMAAYFEEKSMSGFASWFKVQAKEEVEHAEKFITYLEDNGERVSLPALEQPDVSFASVAAALKKAYDHECYVTASINEIAKAAQDANDYRTTHFLGWFHEEQLEEEKTARDLLEEYEYIGEDRAAQRDLDRKLGKRE